MTSSMMRGVRRCLALLAAGSAFPGVAAAQSPQARLPPGAIVQPLSPDDGAELRGHLVTLAQNPRSVDALVGAGRAALRTGDAQAALTFFGRANELSPRNARVRAGMASALVHLGQADTALALFTEAVGLGAPEVEIASERGLAHDLVGDVRRAQQDYLLVLRRGDDAEVRRRLALSLAISGRRDAALRLIDAQLRANDRAGWRTQAFILALTGDAAGATRTMQGFMAPADAQAMAPFLQRLSSLNPAHKAGAVHLGYFPSAGQAGGASVQADVAADPAALAFAMGGAPAAAARTQTAEAATDDTSGRRPTAENDPSDRFGLRSRARAERRRNRAGAENTSRSTASAAISRSTPPAPTPRPPDAAPARTQAQPPQRQAATASNPVLNPPAPQSQPPARQVQPSAQQPPPRASGLAASRQVEIAEVNTRWAGAPYSAAPRTVTTSSPQPQPPRPDPVPSPPAGQREPRPSLSPTDIPPSTIVPAPGFSLQPSAPSAVPAAAPPAAGLADIAALVEALPAEAPAPSPPAPPPPPRAAPARSEPARAERRPARNRRAEPAHPARHWVQIAGGANKAGLPREFARLRGLAPEQLNGRTAYTTPLRATNRLLVGPFASPREAQEFVNQLARHNVTAFAWTSEAGQEIERLPSGR